jgi:hypothetical protein
MPASEKVRILRQKKSATRESCAQSTKGGGWRRRSLDASQEALRSVVIILARMLQCKIVSLIGAFIVLIF